MCITNRIAGRVYIPSASGCALYDVDARCVSRVAGDAGGVAVQRGIVEDVTMDDVCRGLTI